jgi:hypothetical protein
MRHVLVDDGNRKRKLESSRHSLWSKLCRKRERDFPQRTEGMAADVLLSYL